MRPASAFPPPARRLPRWLLPAVATAAIVAWQLGFNSAAPAPRPGIVMRASMGTCQDAGYFFYFWWHYGLFPVGALDVPHLGATRAEADAFVARHGDRLRMDFGLPTNTPRFGDYGKLLTFVPDVWLRHRPQDASAIPFDELLFIAALVATWWAFRREGRTRLGTLVVLLVGSDPFQVLETYGRGNVFSLPISVALLALAAHLRFLTGRRGIDRTAWAIAIAGGAALACIREVRAEAAFIGIAVAATYLLIRRASPSRRVLLLLAFVLAWGATAQAWSRYWAHEWNASARFVAHAGGRVYPGPRGTHHALWHAMFCGLGDYGGDRGFEWDDRAAFRWAVTRDPATNPHPLPYHVTGDDYYFTETYDGVHHIAPTDVPAYNQLVRARVLDVIRRLPLWYAGILGQRLLAVLRDASPASVTAGAWTLGVPGCGWLLVPVLLGVLWRRRRFELLLLLFTLPLSALAVLVYSGRGMTLYGIAHLLALAVVLDALAGAWRMRHGSPVPASHPGVS